MGAKPTSGTGNQRPDLSSRALAGIDRAPLPMAAVEGAGHIMRYVNPAFCRLIHKTRDELVGNPFSEMLPQKDECVSLLDYVYRTGKTGSYTEQEDSKPHPVFWSYTLWPVIAEPIGVPVARSHTRSVLSTLPEITIGRPPSCVVVAVSTVPV